MYIHTVWQEPAQHAGTAKCSRCEHGTNPRANTNAPAYTPLSRHVCVLPAPSASRRQLTSLALKQTERLPATDSAQLGSRPIATSFLRCVSTVHHSHLERSPHLHKPFTRPHIVHIPVHDTPATFQALALWVIRLLNAPNNTCARKTFRRHAYVTCTSSLCTPTIFASIAASCAPSPFYRTNT